MTSKMRLVDRIGLGGQAFWKGRLSVYRSGQGVLVLAYLVVLGSLLAYTRGMPYVLDNNETFSSLIHARSIYHFGVGETFGLTDETYGLEPAQHPYVYTHGGNFPRLYAFVLYVLGARTAESQILITTFSIGLIALLFAFQFFCRVADPPFAFVYCLLLMTDYVMQTQWLANTWRVWHPFFFFSSLLCVHGHARTGRLPPWLVAVTLLNFACLTYFELVFAAFIGLMATLYAGLLIGGRRLARLVQSCLLIGGGAVLGAGVLATQLIAYLGWSGFLEDAKLTFLARNVAPSDLMAFRSQVWSFVDEHHLVFWDNFLGAGAADFSEFFRWCLLPYSPVLVFVALLIATAWMLSFLPACMPGAASAMLCRSRWVGSALVRVTTAVVLFVCAAVFVYGSFVKYSFPGLTDGGWPFGYVGVPIAAAAITGFGLAARGIQRSCAGLEIIRAWACAVMLLAFVVLARSHTALYADGTSLAPEFRSLVGGIGGETVWRVVLLAVAGLAIKLVLAPQVIRGQERQSLRQLLVFVIAGAIASVTILRLFPGYVMSGYLTRYCPLTVYLHLAPFAMAFYVLSRVGLRGFTTPGAVSRKGPLTPGSPETPVDSTARASMPLDACVTGGALLLLCLLSVYWVMLQAHWVTELDPRDTLLTELRKPRYDQATFVVSNYAAPVAFVTNGWAYFDPIMGRIELRNPEGKFYLRRDFRYLWLADKRSNPRYFEPDYFVCWNHKKLLYGQERCQDIQLVAEARAGTGLLRHREVSRDPSGRDAWSIVRLDWTYPPGSGKKIEWHYRQYRRTLATPD